MLNALKTCSIITQKTAFQITYPSFSNYINKVPNKLANRKSLKTIEMAKQEDADVKLNKTRINVNFKK